MKIDPIVAEVRANRAKLFEKSNCNLKRFIKDAISRQVKSGQHMVLLHRAKRATS